jgi:hypothetical protein
MKIANVCLSYFLIIGLSSSCAVAAGQRRPQCEPQIIPARPPETLCIANGDGSGECYDPITGIFNTINTKNFVCISPSTDARREEWIKAILELK